MNDKMSNHENVTKITPRLSFPGGRCNVIYETRTSDINSITSNAERGSDLDRRRQSGPSSRWTNHRAKAFWCLTVCHWRAGREERVRIVTGGRGANQLNDRSDISISIMKHDQFLAEKTNTIWWNLRDCSNSKWRRRRNGYRTAYVNTVMFCKPYILDVWKAENGIGEIHERERQKDQKIWKEWSERDGIWRTFS